MGWNAGTIRWNVVQYIWWTGVHSLQKQRLEVDIVLVGTHLWTVTHPVAAPRIVRSGVVFES